MLQLNTLKEHHTEIEFLLIPIHSIAYNYIAAFRIRRAMLEVDSIGCMQTGIF
ncbi:hypothetical protein FACS1894109_12370 [Spirochaetia bacterium]|nr:hypothetical protein FACS1894109_12370 [Spirochaetia bacterium]